MSEKTVTSSRLFCHTLSEEPCFDLSAGVFQESTQDLDSRISAATELSTYYFGQPVPLADCPYCKNAPLILF